FVQVPGGGRGLAWASVWDDVDARDRFLEALGPAPAGFPEASTLGALDVSGHPGALLRIGLPESVQVRVGLARP
ncbi:MAG TPA: hypothetical protein VJ997_14435, partial [Longimicrobiales bacterium]|nr:hypothetical protein [Longimicrobiales bacterium]